MASVCSSPGGRKAIQFTGPGGRRHTVRLGRCGAKDAESVKLRIEYMLAALVRGMPFDLDTSAWLASVGDVLHRRLAAAGLCAPRRAGTLGAFCAAYVARRAPDLSPLTVRNLKDCAARLTEHFEPGGVPRPLASLTEDDAQAWLAALRRRYADATCHRTVKRARQFWAAAVKAGLASGPGPFRALRLPPDVDESRRYFVTREQARRLLDACPDARWRLIVALCRYGGLRCPTELAGLSWADVDWDRQRFRVSWKTAPRWVPVFPELAPHLDAAWAAAEEGATLVLPGIGADTNLRHRLEGILRVAGLDQWPKLFHALRASRQTELEDQYPTHVVCAWLGNSPAVARKHYLQVHEEHFTRAVSNYEHPDRRPDASADAPTPAK